MTRSEWWCGIAGSCACGTTRLTARGSVETRSTRATKAYGTSPASNAPVGPPRPCARPHRRGATGRAASSSPRPPRACHVGVSGDGGGDGDGGVVERLGRRRRLEPWRTRRRRARPRRAAARRDRAEQPLRKSASSLVAAVKLSPWKRASPSRWRWAAPDGAARGRGRRSGDARHRHVRRAAAAAAAERGARLDRDEDLDERGRGDLGVARGAYVVADGEPQRRGLVDLLRGDDARRVEQLDLGATRAAAEPAAAAEAERVAHRAVARAPELGVRASPTVLAEAHPLQRRVTPGLSSDRDLRPSSRLMAPTCPRSGSQSPRRAPAAP